MKVASIANILTLLLNPCSYREPLILLTVKG